MAAPTCIRTLLPALWFLAVPVLAQDPPGDGAENSLVKPLASRSLLLDAVAVEGRMVAVGERGHVLISDDDGESWRQALAVPTRATQPSSRCCSMSSRRSSSCA